MSVNSSSSGTSADRIVWIDCEMTGLDIGTDALVEVAVVVTDSELNVLGEGVDVVICPPPAAVEQMGYAGRMTHISTGGGASLELIEGRALPGVAALQDKR